MTLMIPLSPEEEKHIRKEAERRGLEAAEYARLLLIENLPAEPPNAAQLIQSWIDEGDEAEQQKTLEALRQGLNANHSSDRTIFP